MFDSYPDKWNNGSCLYLAGRHVEQHVSIDTVLKTNLEKYHKSITDCLTNLNTIDEWHDDALVDIFTSELALGMSNNIGDYIWPDLAPEKYEIPALPPRPGRSLEQIQTYISLFSNTSHLLQHIFAEELRQHLTEKDTKETLIFHTTCYNDDLPASDDEQEKGLASKPKFCSDPISINTIVKLMIVRANTGRKDTTVPKKPLEAIIDLCFPELLYVIRQCKKSENSIAFSIASSADHSIAISTPVKPNTKVIERLIDCGKILTNRGEVKPTWVEYTALYIIFLTSTILLIFGVISNWANRRNILERIFDGIGLFGVSSGVMLAILSRRLDFHDLISILLRKKRYISSYSELLEILRVSDHELKHSLTFEGVKVSPLASDTTNYAFEKHDGPFSTFSGLDTSAPYAKGANIILGNHTALSRGHNSVQYYDTVGIENICHLKASNNAKFRIVTSGDFKVVK